MIVNFQPKQYFSLTQTSQPYFFTNQQQYEPDKRIEAGVNVVDVEQVAARRQLPHHVARPHVLQAQYAQHAATAWLLFLRRS